MKITSSFKWAFSRRSLWRLRCRSSSPNGGPPQDGQMTFLNASLIARFSHWIFSFSVRSEELSARSFWVCKRGRTSLNWWENKNKQTTSLQAWEDSFYLRLSPLVLKPKFDLFGLKTKLSTQLAPLIFIRVWACPEKSGKQTETIRFVLEGHTCMHRQTRRHQIVETKIPADIISKTWEKDQTCEVLYSSKGMSKRVKQIQHAASENTNRIQGQAHKNT